MLVSVTIPAYNAAEYLREAIESALAQTYREIEIVVVDDGSTDHTRKVCESYGDRVRYFYIENDGTAGFGARYRSFREAQGQWIALLDQDDRWLPTKIERQIETLKNFPDAGLVFTKCRVIDEHGREQSALTQDVARGGAYRLDSHEALHTLFRSNPFSPSSALVSRRALDECGEPDTSAAGDWDMWFRVSKGHPLVVVDELLTEYRVSGEQFCSNKESLARRMWRTLDRNEPLARRDCAQCRESLREGRAHVRDVFAVAARTHLDEFHAAVRRGGIGGALSLLWRAVKCSPSEVLKPRRLMAVSKSYAVGTAKVLKGSRATP
jgi:glycosyltransferase involved in cell wall biosynthesis